MLWWLLPVAILAVSYGAAYAITYRVVDDFYLPALVFFVGILATLISAAWVFLR